MCVFENVFVARSTVVVQRVEVLKSRLLPSVRTSKATSFESLDHAGCEGKPPPGLSCARLVESLKSLSVRWPLESKLPSSHGPHSTCLPSGEIASKPEFWLELKSDAPVAGLKVPQGLCPPLNEATSADPSFETLWHATQLTPAGIARKLVGAAAPGWRRTTLPALMAQ